ncbi:hypothetical protein DV736_g4830, partial [Chaetothyriales sp. CBS 134916]
MPRTTSTATTTTTAASVEDNDATDEHYSTAQAAVAKTVYPRDLTTSIDESSGLLRCIDTVNNRSESVFWVTHQIGPGALVLGPQVVFDVRPGSKQMRYGMAFDYDDQLGIVASASTDFYRTHRLGLWDVSSGRILEPSPLVKHGFSQPVTCAQFVDLEHRGGIKSLLTASGKDILAWDM